MGGGRRRNVYRLHGGERIGDGLVSALHQNQHILRHALLTLLGTAGTWFVFDYAYYGNAVSAPKIVLQVLGHGATLQQSLLLNLLIFSVFAVPCYILACLFMDRIGHRRLQLIGFPAMGAMFLMIALIPGATTATAPFLLLFGASYFFAEFGPNTTTFVMAAECYPTSVRTTGHGLSAGIAFNAVQRVRVGHHHDLPGPLRRKAKQGLLGLDLRRTEWTADGGFGHIFAVPHGYPTACNGVLT